MGGAGEDDGNTLRAGAGEGESGTGKAPVSGANEPGRQVPLELYEHMEREAQLLRTELRHKECALQERSEVVEHLERKLHVMSHSKESELRKIRREAAAAIAGIKMSVGGSFASDAGRDTPRQMSGNGDSLKKNAGATASPHRGLGEVVYMNSLGSFYQRQSPCAPASPSLSTPRLVPSGLAAEGAPHSGTSSGFSVIWGLRALSSSAA